ncbi:MAG: STT3 domain-containing protein [Candidatus Aenigmatarchaeota archaeon]
MEIKKSLNRFFVPIAITAFLVATFLLALKLRATPALINPPWLPQFDSYWFFRYAKMIVDNHGVLPNWDPLSYFPPGRPTDKSTQFYTYLLAYSFLAAKKFIHELTLVQSTKWTAAILASLAVIPSYFIGKYMGGRVSGLLTSILIAVSPAILVRTGADPDNDGSVVVLTMFSFFALMRLIKEPNWKNALLSIIVLTMFALSWYPFWYVIIITIAGILLNVAVSFVQSAIKKDKRLFEETVSQSKPRLKYSAIVVLGIVVVPLLLGVNTIGYFGGFLQFGTNPQGQSIVNVSVAELQKLDIFSLGGWQQIIGRTAGLEFLTYIIPTLPQFLIYLAEALAVIALAYSAWATHAKKKNTEAALLIADAVVSLFLILLKADLVTFLQIVLFLGLAQYAILATFRRNRSMGTTLFVWIAFTFYAISSGVRFTLLFAPAAAVAVAVGLGELWLWANKKEAGILHSIENKILGEKDE